MHTPSRSRSRALTRSRLTAIAVGAFAGLGFSATAQAHQAEITRTTGGIAHIKAANLADAGYGVGYAAAQDNLCTLADTFLTANGKRAYYLGAGTGNTNAQSDLFWTSVKDRQVVEGLLAKGAPEGPSADARALTQGYVAGYNRYLEDKGGSAGVTDPRCKNAAWVKPVTEVEMWRVVHMLSMRASTDQFVLAFLGAQPPAVGASQAQGRSVVKPSKYMPTDQQIADSLEGVMKDERVEPVIGSNAVGAGKDASTSGNSGVVLGNPHFPWAGNERFWEFGVEVPGDFKSIGAGLMGSPIPNIGHNEHVAWSHTVSTARRFNMQELTLAAGKPTTYVVDGQEIPMTPQKVTVDVQLFEGAHVQTSHTLWHTKYGPAVIFPSSSSGSPYINLLWTNTKAYAFQDANAGNLRLFDQWLAMNRADSSQELVDSQKRILGIPWVNTIGADDKGNAFYSDVTVVPNLPLSKLSPGPDVTPPFGAPGTGCLRSNAAAAGSQANLWILDGSRSDCGLLDDPSAPQAGIMGGATLPARVTPGWTQNANDSYWLTNPDEGNFPQNSPVFGPFEKAQGLRTQLGIDMVRKRIAGTDGQPGTKFSLETMKGMWLNHRSLGAERTLDDLVDLCDDRKGATPAIADACDVLRSYGKTGLSTDKGGWLFARWFARASTASTFWAVPFSVADPVNTPNTLNTANGPAADAMITSLTQAINELAANNVPLNASHGDVQHTMRGNERIPIPGCNTGCYPVISASTTTGPNYGRVSSGSSFVMFAEMTPAGPRSQALLSYSQSEDVTSPFYADQTKRFSDLDFIELPWSAAQIEAAKLSRITLAPKAGPLPPLPPKVGPQPNPDPQPKLEPADEPKVSLSSKKGLSFRLMDFGGRKLRSAKITLPKGWAINTKRAKRSAHLKVKTKGAKPKRKVTRRTITVTTTRGATDLRISTSKSLIRKTSKSKKRRTVTVKVVLRFTDGTRQTQSIKVRAA